MAEAGDGGLFAIEVDADDYATTAADDTPTASRTFQSEVDFEAQKAAYRARIDHGRLDAEFIRLLSDASVPTALNKRDVLLLGYAVGELYYDQKYQPAITLCHRVLDTCSVDDKVRMSLTKWIDRCRNRMGTR